MRILHYALGFPPYRTGGMTKFCMDLIHQQNKDGHKVALMWPGQMGFVFRKVLVQDRGVLDGGIHSYEVINPLPVPYDEGIKDFIFFIKDGGKEAYSKLLEEYKPDIIHVHTLMGLHRSFLEEAKNRKIRLVFTVHDFFPICPKVTMFRHGAICSSVETCTECGICNTTALNINKIKILQSPIYRKFKNCSLIKKLRKLHRDEYLSENRPEVSNKPTGNQNDYKYLRMYYDSMLRLMDVIHYNSSITKSVYETFFNLPNHCTINITHADIGDHRQVKQFTSEILRIRYLGPMSRSKGFFYLRRLLINYGRKDKTSA